MGAILVAAGGCGGATSHDGDGGQAASGGRSGTGGAVGTGGIPIHLPTCGLPLEAGSCDGALEAWGFDAGLGRCVPFFYGGCGANQNNFASRELCEATCGAAPSLDACDVTTPCVLVETSCCGACEPVTAESYAAVPAGQTEAYEAQKACGGMPCDACDVLPLGQQTSQFFRAACVEGRCAVQDVRDEPITECEVPADCRLRCGSDCCEGCGSGSDGLIAVRADADVAATFCEGRDVACDPCICTPSATYGADCVAGRCVVVGVPVCTPGFDPSCNLDPTMSAIAGTCGADGTCTCAAGRMQDPTTGLCT